MRVYMLGVVTILACNMILLVPMVNRSAQGAILETAARRMVAPILTVKYVSYMFFFKCFTRIEIIPLMSDEITLWSG